MSKRTIIEQLRESKKLPSPSAVVLKILRLCQTEDVPLTDIITVIETDPALTAELLKYANSTLMGSQTPVLSIQRAAIRLGLNNVVNLALGFSLLSQNQTGRCQTFNYPRFWSRSLAQAVAARSIAEVQGKYDPEELFVCGLLAHIGELALASVFPLEYARIFSRELSRMQQVEQENEIFGYDHNDISTELLLHWGIPEEFAQGVGFHERYQMDSIANRPTTELAGLLYLAQQIAEICLLEIPQAGTLLSVEDLAAKYSVSADAFSGFFDKIVSRWQECSHVFRIPAQQCPLYHQIRDFSGIYHQDEETQEPSEGGLKILVVDDDPLTLLNLRTILANEDRTIISANDGEEALDKAVEQQPQMIITDWRMPGIDGLELCKILRRTSISEHVYIIMLTGCETDEELIQAFDAGADDYVVKPFRPKVLEARIRSGERLIRYQRTINQDRELIQQYVSRLATANRSLLTLAMTDALTGLPNRRSAMARMNDAVAEAKRFNEQLSCIMIDLDHFKAINDSYGHDSGDQALKDVAAIFLDRARSYDMVSRTGGEEFLVISSRTDLAKAAQLAERLRCAVQDHDFVLQDGRSLKLTISLGVAAWSSDCPDGDALIKTADRALYMAKLNGRNRVETA